MDKIIEGLQRITAALLLIWFVVFVVSFVYGVANQNVGLVTTVMLGLVGILLPWVVGGIIWLVYVLFREVLDFVIHGRKD